MKPLLSFCLLLTLLSCQNGIDSQATKERLKTILSDYYNAMAKKDIQKMNELTAKNFVFFDEGKVYNNETALKSIEPIGSFTASFSFDSVNAHIDKANASAYYFRAANFTIGDSTYPTMKFVESATFEKESGKWKLRFLHSSIRQP